ncbi:nucleotidyltransferase family protein [Candidatus Berkelbacteria bacterium]|nr:nucleotidyltransferase family protein [Candidatus Berkelbacteria bacterium]
MERERVTITIRRDVLERVDRTVDGVTVRNRSHAMERLVSQALGSGIESAVILAGGRGHKLRPSTDELPTALIPVQDRPILEYTLLLLREHGVRTVFILTGHLGEKLEQRFGKGAGLGLTLHYLHEKTPLGTAGALRKLPSSLWSQPFFLIHGDVLARINLSDMAAFHQECGRAVTMALTSVADPSPYGSVRVSGTGVVSFQEKPTSSPSVSRLINAGIYILDGATLQGVPKAGQSFLERDVFPQLAQTHALTGYIFEGPWFDISSPESYERAVKEW